MRALHEEGIGTAAQSFNISTYHFHVCAERSSGVECGTFQSTFRPMRRANARTSNPALLRK